MARFFIIALVCILFPTQVWSDDYTIGDGDGLSISVWGVPELSVGAVVRPDGKITLPAAGDVVATGLTPAELSQNLTEVLESYVKKPIVTVAVTGVTNNRVYIFGGGVPATVKNLSGSTTLFKLLVSLPEVENVDFKLARLIRNGENQQVDFYTLFNEGDLSKDVKIESEDILYLPTNERNKIYVVGAVIEPQFVMYRDGLRILDAIFACGGFSKFAKQKEVLILRRTENDGMERLIVNIKELVEDGKLTENIKLARGDYVIVEEGIF